MRSSNAGHVQPVRRSPAVAICESRPSPEPSTLAPAGIGSSTTTHVMSDCASMSRWTRYTSPRDHAPFTFCSIGVTVRAMR
jgi:hypothetical protein